MKILHRWVGIPAANLDRKGETMKKLGLLILSGIVGLGLIGLMATLVFTVDKGMRAVGIIGGH